MAPVVREVRVAFHLPDLRRWAEAVPALPAIP
jgi:hypothetical protein